MDRRAICGLLLATGAVNLAAPLQAETGKDPGQPLEDHTAWVGKLLERMLTIKPGMDRAALLAVFTTEGGLSSRFQRRYVSRECPYFKVNVEFDAVGLSGRIAEGGELADEDLDDRILKVSEPFLEFSIMD
jgi:hypothetical protein